MIHVKNYIRVRSLEEAWELNQKKGNVIAGGIGWMKMQNNRKQTLIDLAGLGLDQIEETDGEFRIGCMCTLRQIETHEGLNRWYQNLLKESVKHIVGVQFRNGATVGGSIYGRFGFSDVLTAFLVLDCYVELYHGGLIPLEKFAGMPYDNDVLVRILIKKDRRTTAYVTQRNSKTDFPLLALAAAKKAEQWYFSIGARPAKARLVKITGAEMTEGWIERLLAQYQFGTNLRGGKEYRIELARIYLERLVTGIENGADVN